MGRSWLRWGALVSAGTLGSSAAFGQARGAPAVELGRGGHVEVALHARATQASARSERAAWLTLSLPLDRAAVPRAAEVPSAPSPVAAAEAPVAAPASFRQLRALV